MATPTLAGTVVLGSSGWAASWAPSLDPYVGIVVDGENATQVFIQKAAEFTQGPGPGGIFPTIPITFQQIAPTTVTQIVINDEIITNSTGHDWTDFHFQLVDSGDAAFNQPLSDASSANGFSSTPFDNQTWEGPAGPPGWYTGLTVDGFGLGPSGSNATIPGQFPGNVWFPGDGAFDGELYIQVNPHAQAPFTTFTLKETPTYVPEPSTAVLMVIGVVAWAVGRARRRARRPV